METRCFFFPDGFHGDSLPLMIRFFFRTLFLWLVILIIREFNSYLYVSIFTSLDSIACNLLVIYRIYFDLSKSSIMI